MRFRYDLHLHSCLSPCGDSDMTPYNIVNMAKLLGYDVIALTDHNTTGNCRSAMRAGEEAGIVVVPGMELCTSEEIHMVCLFPTIGQAEACGAFIKATLPPIRNKPDVFGHQLYMDSADNVLGEEEILLITASSVSVEEAAGVAARYGGCCFPAHIDRESYSILASLGAIPPELGLRCAELSLDADPDAYRAYHPVLEHMRILRSSDAHYLENMPDPRWSLELPENSPRAVVEKLLAGL